MNIRNAGRYHSGQKSLRLWPGIVLAILLLLVRYVLVIVLPERMDIAALGGIFGGLAIIIWWAFFSRASRVERWGAVALMITAMVISWFLLHESISTGNMGLMFAIHAIPVMALIFVGWAIATRHLPPLVKRLLLFTVIILGCGIWTLLRSTGISGYGMPEFAWRWSEAPEERFLSSSTNVPEGSHSVITATATETGWPGFRGPGRDGIVHGVKINTNWKAAPPVELWRRPIGPGCSSCAIEGNLLYTQEQLGEDELVSCFNLLTGEPLWKHHDKARFWDSHVGAGPRGTPTVSNGRLYTFGATGILNVLDAYDGSVIWSHNIATDIPATIPVWGFSGSPLVVHDAVIVAAAGSLLAYERSTGRQLWMIPAGGECYASPHLAHIAGVEQILVLTEAGVQSVAPGDGTLLWKHPWPGTPILQPASLPNGDILISASTSSGLLCLHITKGNEGWDISERWKSTRIKPIHNDFIFHNGFVYGIDGAGIACIDIKTGERTWKGKRYGGQLILLPDQEILLVLSEKGKLNLVKATHVQFKELASLPAIEGKTWNHPALAGNILVVRNTLEMAAFRLATAEN